MSPYNRDAEFNLQLVPAGSEKAREGESAISVRLSKRVIHTQLESIERQHGRGPMIFAAGRSLNDMSYGFEFLDGHWSIRNRRLSDLLDAACDEWVEFDAVGEDRPILHGLGNRGRFSAESMPPAGGPFEGFTLRLFDVQRGVWRIWWASTAQPGRLDPPVEGSFGRDGIGRFACDDVIGGNVVTVRFEWIADRDTPVWRQSFSYDGGATWRTNWVMELTRLA
jgi:hypothetical protein